jgi:hypothetical protein
MKKVSNFCSIFRSCDLDLCPKLKTVFVDIDFASWLDFRLSSWLFIFLFIWNCSTVFLAELRRSRTRLVSFRSYIVFLIYRAEMKKVSNFCSIFRSCDLDLCPTVGYIPRKSVSCCIYLSSLIQTSRTVSPVTTAYTGGILFGKTSLTNSMIAKNFYLTTINTFLSFLTGYKLLSIRDMTTVVPLRYMSVLLLGIKIDT